MDFQRVWENIKQFAAWFSPVKRGEDKEILKPLNQLIDFEKGECIQINHILSNGIEF